MTAPESSSPLDLGVIKEEIADWQQAYTGTAARRHQAIATALLSALAEAQRERDEARAALSIVEANFDEADAERERMRPVLEAAKEIVFDWWKQVAAGETFDDDVLPLEAALVRAVDTYESQESTE